MRRHLAVIVTALVSLPLPAGANKRLMAVEPLSAADLRQVPAGAAVWFHKGGRYWFHLPIAGHGYMRIDRRLWKFRRIRPTGNTWGCMPMAFRRRQGGTVRIYKEAGGWTVSFTFGTQSNRIKGLVCASGD